MSRCSETKCVMLRSAPNTGAMINSMLCSVPSQATALAELSHLDHQLDMPPHGRHGSTDVFLRIALAELISLPAGKTLRVVTIQRIVGAGLVGERIDLNLLCNQGFEQIDCVAANPY